MKSTTLSSELHNMKAHESATHIDHNSSKHLQIMKQCPSLELKFSWYFYLDSISLQSFCRMTNLFLQQNIFFISSARYSNSADVVTHAPPPPGERNWKSVFKVAEMVRGQLETAFKVFYPPSRNQNLYCVFLHTAVISENLVSLHVGSLMLAHWQNQGLHTKLSYLPLVLHIVPSLAQWHHSFGSWRTSSGLEILHGSLPTTQLQSVLGPNSYWVTWNKTQASKKYMGVV